MLSIIILLVLLIVILACIKASRHDCFKYLAVGTICFLVIECFIYGYFLLLIAKGTCFFLIGNQKVLDNLIKVRLTYATYFAQGKKNFTHQLNNSLGYTIGADKDSGIYQTNLQGFRADREYTLHPAENILRIATFGDSMVFCDSEKNPDAWPQILEDSAENLEVLNFGVPGHGLGQSYLRYLKDGLRFNPDIIVFNYILTGERDRINPFFFVDMSNLRYAHIYRVRFRLDKDGILQSKSVTPFDLFNADFRKKELYEKIGLEKKVEKFSSKFFSISNTGLLIKMSAIYNAARIVNTDPGLGPVAEPDINLNVKILKNLIAAAKQNRSAILFFHNADIRQLPVEIQSLIKNNSGHVAYVNAVERLTGLYLESGIIDKAEHQYLLDQFNSRRDNELEPHTLLTIIKKRPWSGKILNHTKHFNARGNKIYAEAILQILKKREWRTGSGAFRFNKRSGSFQKTEPRR